MEYNQNANVRTLIVCFVVAVFALIPLRFYEASQLVTVGSAQVLGDVTEDITLPPVYEEVVPAAPMFEAPYDELEAGSVQGAVTECVARGEMEDLIKMATSSDMSDEQKDSLINEIANLSVCE